MLCYDNAGAFNLGTELARVAAELKGIAKERKRVLASLTKLEKEEQALTRLALPSPEQARELASARDYKSKLLDRDIRLLEMGVKLQDERRQLLGARKTC